MAHRRKRSKLALEPNPFEESFSLARPTQPISQPHVDSKTRRHSHEAPAQPRARPSSTPVSGHKSESPGNRIKLPPVAAINGPADVGDGGAWGAESLRSGPLSPAMLVGPAEPAKPGRPARMGVSDPALHTGLTPFLAGESSSSPLRLHSAVVTPGLQAMIHAAFDGNHVTTTPGGSLQLADRPRLPPPDSACSAPNDEALSTMAGQPPPATDKPGQRKQLAIQPPPPAQAKRARKSKASSKSPATDTKPDEDDGKRRQFLERNRIAALKCRQRKKRQLQELQDRHDYMMSENERLRAEYARMREAALRVRALLAAHSECATARANGVFGTDNLPVNTPSVSLRPLLLPGIVGSAEGEKAREVIAAIPPASNGVPIHDVDVAASVSHALSPSRDPPLPAKAPAAVYNAHAPVSH
ncbi:Transcription factor [Coemansia sp. RSA 2336]|nr:Transcription factor [Coemansia sp. RSA 2336]